ncbi:hypothetical protein LOK74_20380 [Brevibacillus humidisoli]|uniref:hypothetical protein n=1 Tax=Brevibacillus humidisoli TaxID=2895522 RepID=UPI001E334915|nr:hypothetical protein [Brevibacillus humidisoli]UFJ40361.1 hypothetical protein LOK74_20380 [Brevibacillus humidisoli]
MFADTLILPFAFIIYVYYASKTKHPWRITLLFASGFIILELFYLKLGYIAYIRWNIGYSATFYIIGFRLGAFLAPRLKSYMPPIPYRVRLLAFSHMIIMWFGALFASPLLKLYQYKLGLFHDPMADCRFVDLLSGEVLAILCTMFIPSTPMKYRPLVFTLVAGIGISFAFYSYYHGWLIYHDWNHFLTAFRYIAPIFMIMLYDRWETAYVNRIVGA